MNIIGKDLLGKVGLEKAEEIGDVLENYLDNTTLYHPNNSERVKILACILKLEVEGEEVFVCKDMTVAEPEVPDP